jgi:hypothetical protein
MRLMLGKTRQNHKQAKKRCQLAEKASTLISGAMRLFLGKLKQIRPKAAVH